MKQTPRRKICRQEQRNMTDTERRNGSWGTSNGYSAKTTLWGYNLPSWWFIQLICNINKPNQSFLCVRDRRQNRLMQWSGLNLQQRSKVGNSMSHPPHSHSLTYLLVHTCTHMGCTGSSNYTVTHGLTRKEHYGINFWHCTLSSTEVFWPLSKTECALEVWRWMIYGLYGYRGSKLLPVKEQKDSESKEEK